VTAGESVLIGLLASMHKASAVLLAAAQAGAVTLGLSLFALLNKNRKYDLTAFGSALGGTLLIFVISTILCTVFRFPLNEVMVGGFGATLFSLFLIYDLQRVVGGPGHEHQLDDRDWVNGCVEIYLDITRLFLYLLRIIAASESGGGGGGGGQD
jgi:FtsH-binding integral membrane protein